MKIAGHMCAVGRFENQKKLSLIQVDPMDAHKNKNISIFIYDFFTPWPELFPVAWIMAYTDVLIFVSIHGIHFTKNPSFLDFQPALRDSERGGL